MKPPESEISLSIEGYDKITAENYRNIYDAENRIFSKLSKILIQILIAQF